jgi:circadian clock protein KaiC
MGLAVTQQWESGVGTRLQKASTGISGLDDILHGGVPARRTTLISGGPGTGKTVVALQFLLEGIRQGEPGIFLTMEERAEGIRENALSLGWDLVPAEQDGSLFLFDARLDPQAVLSGSFDLGALLAIIGGAADAMGAKRIVIDALDMLMRLFDDPRQARNQVYALHEWLTDRELTVILTAKAAHSGETIQPYDFLDFMADCVIFLDNRVADQLSTRRLRVIKFRGSSFSRSENPYIITENGIRFIPMAALELGHAALGQHVSSGQPTFDDILGGGFRQASCTLISGTTGTGKTTLASTFSRAACQRGEKVLYLDFEESQDALLSGMMSSGIDLRPAIDAGCLLVLSTMPEAMGAEEHLIRTVDMIDRFHPDHLILDAVSSISRMGSEQAAFDFLVRLLNIAKERGITIILINQTAGFMDEHEISGVGISSLVDTVVFLRYVESGGEINRNLLVLKSRGNHHSNQYREYRITNDGIQIAELFGGEGGTLTGAARQEQELRQALDEKRRQQQRAALETQIAQRKAARAAQLAEIEAEIATAELELENLQLEEEIRHAGRATRLRMRGSSSNGDQATGEPEYAGGGSE